MKICFHSFQWLFESRLWEKKTWSLFNNVVHAFLWAFLDIAYFIFITFSVCSFNYFFSPQKNKRLSRMKWKCEAIAWLSFSYIMLQVHQMPFQLIFTIQHLKHGERCTKNIKQVFGSVKKRHAFFISILVPIDRMPVFCLYKIFHYMYFSVPFGPGFLCSLHYYVLSFSCNVMQWKR